MRNITDGTLTPLGHKRCIVSCNAILERFSCQNVVVIRGHIVRFPRHVVPAIDPIPFIPEEVVK